MSKAKNSNAPWTIEDDRYLLDALSNGRTYLGVGRVIGRSAKACEMRQYKYKTGRLAPLPEPVATPKKVTPKTGKRDTDETKTLVDTLVSALKENTQAVKKLNDRLDDYEPKTNGHNREPRWWHFSGH